MIRRPLTQTCVYYEYAVINDNSTIVVEIYILSIVYVVDAFLRTTTFRHAGKKGSKIVEILKGKNNAMQRRRKKKAKREVKICFVVMQEIVCMNIRILRRYK